MLRGMGPWRDCEGASLTLLTVAMPVLLSVLGLVVDSGLYGLTVVRLSSAGDSAALAAASAVDLAYYGATGQVRLDPMAAQAKAEAFSQVNFPDGVQTSVTIEATNPRRAKVTLQATFQPVFMRIFGITTVTLEARSEAEVG